MRNLYMTFFAALIFLCAALAIGFTQEGPAPRPSGQPYHLIEYDDTVHSWETIDHSPMCYDCWYEFTIPAGEVGKVLCIKPRLEYESRGGEWDRYVFEIDAIISRDGGYLIIPLLEDEFQGDYNSPHWIIRQKLNLVGETHLPPEFVGQELTVSICWDLWSHTNDWDNSYYRVQMNGCSVWGE